MNSPAPHTFTVQLHDTDAAGVMFFAHLFRHAHDAYEGLMAEVGYPLDELIRNDEPRLPLVHAEADFLRPIRHGDRIEVHARVSDLAERHFTLTSDFLRDGERVARCTTKHVAATENGAVALPSGLAERLQDICPRLG